MGGQEGSAGQQLCFRRSDRVKVYPVFSDQIILLDLFLKKYRKASLDYTAPVAKWGPLLKVLKGGTVGGAEIRNGTLVPRCESYLSSR